MDADMHPCTLLSNILQVEAEKNGTAVPAAAAPAAIPNAPPSDTGTAGSTATEPDSTAAGAVCCGLPASMHACLECSGEQRRRSCVSKNEGPNGMRKQMFVCRTAPSTAAAAKPPTRPAARPTLGAKKPLISRKPAAKAGGLGIKKMTTKVLTSTKRTVTQLAWLWVAEQNRF